MRRREYTERNIEELLDNISYLKQIKTYIPSHLDVITEEKKNVILYCYKNDISAFDCAVKINNAFLDQF